MQNLEMSEKPPLKATGANQIGSYPAKRDDHKTAHMKWRIKVFTVMEKKL